MNISIQPSPAQGKDLAAASFLARQHHGKFGAMVSARAGIGPGIPTFAMRVSKRLATAHLTDARLSGWRYPVIAGQHVALVTLGMDNGQLFFRDISTGAFARSVVDAVAFAEKAATRSKASFELRMLEAPALQLSYLWLSRPGSNRFVDLRPSTMAADGGRELLTSIRQRVRDEYFTRTARPSV